MCKFIYSNVASKLQMKAFCDLTCELIVVSLAHEIFLKLILTAISWQTYVIALSIRLKRRSLKIVKIYFYVLRPFVFYIVYWSDKTIIRRNGWIMRWVWRHHKWSFDKGLVCHPTTMRVQTAANWGSVHKTRPKRMVNVHCVVQMGKGSRQWLVDITS